MDDLDDVYAEHNVPGKLTGYPSCHTEPNVYVCTQYDVNKDIREYDNTT